MSQNSLCILLLYLKEQGFILCFQREITETASQSSEYFADFLSCIIPLKPIWTSGMPLTHVFDWASYLTLWASVLSCRNEDQTQGYCEA